MDESETRMILTSLSLCYTSDLVTADKMVIPRGRRRQSKLKILQPQKLDDDPAADFLLT